MVEKRKKKAAKKKSTRSSKQATAASGGHKKKKRPSARSRSIKKSKESKLSPHVQEETVDFGRLVGEGLTDRQAAFVREFIIDNNGLQAAIRAGYSKRSAGQTSTRLLKDEKVSAAIHRAQLARAERTNITADRVLKELGRIGLADIRDLFVWDKTSAAFIPSKHLTEEQAAAVSSVKARTTTTRHPGGAVETKTFLEIKTHDKVRALIEIGKHLGVGENMNVFIRDETSGLNDEQLAVRGKQLAEELLRRTKRK